LTRRRGAESRVESAPRSRAEIRNGVVVSRSLLIVVVTLAVVGASYYAFSRLARNSDPRPGAPAVSAPGGAAPIPASPAPQPKATGIATAAPPRTFTIVVDKARPPAPADVIRVEQDAPVTLEITSDRAGHVEVHGYREEVAVEPGKTATLSFKAVRTGRFPIDLHARDGGHVEVTALEVMPR
jgi:hypothetical protein